MNSIKIKKNSLTHDILMVSKVFNKLISIENLREINFEYYSDITSIKKSLLYLDLHNLILLNTDDTWIITPLGIQYLYQMPK